MNSTVLPNAAVDRERKSSSRLPFYLLAGIIVVVAAAVYFGWNASAFGGRFQPQQHVKMTVKKELDKRFQEGVAMLHAKQYEHALTAFHRVLQLDPEMPEAYVNSGFALLGMKDYKTAADFFDSATTLRPNQLNAYYGLGEALQGLGNTHGALQAMETYMHRSPKSDPFRRKAESAIWELRAELEKAGGSPPSGDVPHKRKELGAQP
jgi:cytochrome c-type biogenesis protein CcmH/NrfG